MVMVNSYISVSRIVLEKIVSYSLVNGLLIKHLYQYDTILRMAVINLSNIYSKTE